MSAEEDARGRCAGTAPPRNRRTSLSWRGGSQHLGRRTGTWPWGLLLAEPPPRVVDHTCGGDEAATEARKACDTLKFQHQNSPKQLDSIVLRI
jgi:hypothetical protein